MSLMDAIGRKLLFSLDPETAHGVSIAALRCGLPAGPKPARDERLRVRLCGLDFPNPLGMAAGYDKNAEVPDALLGLGFGFAEVGTITPLAQPGNPRPRIFRLTSDEAVINRLGFNNEGHEAALRRLDREEDTVWRFIDHVHVARIRCARVLHGHAVVHRASRHERIARVR